MFNATVITFITVVFVMVFLFVRSWNIVQSYMNLQMKQTLHTDLFGQPLLEMEFDTIREAKDYIKQFDDVSGKPIYGNRRFEYSFHCRTTQERS